MFVIMDKSKYFSPTKLAVYDMYAQCHDASKEEYGSC